MHLTSILLGSEEREALAILKPFWHANQSECVRRALREALERIEGTSFMPRRTPRCAYCRRTRAEAQGLVAVEQGHICNSCLSAACVRALAREHAEEAETKD